MAQQPDTVVIDTSEMPAMDSAYAFGRGYEKEVWKPLKIFKSPVTFQMGYVARSVFIS